jgi:rhamnose utilization protein RhaD (predicted bifunctional aldolase and dehydrogenase)
MKLSHQDQAVTLARLGRRIGWRIPTWVQGAGGNVSLKSERDGRPILLIKSSGTRLDQITPTQGYSLVDTALFTARCDLSKKSPGKGQEAVGETQYANALGESQIPQEKSALGERPSMETGLHIALESPMVAHFHSLPAILMGHHLQQDRRLKSWLEHEVKGEVAFLRPMMPGRELALETYAHRQAKVLIVANHGVILAMHKLRDIALWEKIERLFLKKHEYFDVLDIWDGGHRQNLEEKARKTPIPLKFYFPDTAVFADDIQKSLVTMMGSDGENIYTLHSHRQDLLELWTAQQILFTACPQLASLPHSMVTKIRKLPTEEYRLAKAAS